MYSALWRARSLTLDPNTENLKALLSSRAEWRRSALALVSSRNPSSRASRLSCVVSKARSLNLFLLPSCEPAGCLF